MSNEQKVDCTSLDDARNRAVRKLEELIGGSLGGYVKIVVAKNMGGGSPLAGNEVGTEYRTSKGWGRIRLDFDPHKGPHYNVETNSQAWAFCFPFTGHEGAGAMWWQLGEEEKAAVQEWMHKIGSRRGLR